MRVLAFSCLFPNSQQPNFGVFLEHRLTYLAAEPGVELRVVAPVPWFPFKHRIFGRYATYASISKKKSASTLDVTHPRFIAIPKLGMYVTPLVLAFVLYREVKRQKRSGFIPDIVDAYYLYPDSIAVAM